MVSVGALPGLLDDFCCCRCWGVFSSKDGVVVARNLRSRIFVNVVNLCALVGGGTVDASGKTRKGTLFCLAPS